MFPNRRQTGSWPEIVEFKIFRTRQQSKPICFAKPQFTQVVEVVEVFSAGIFEVMNASSFAAASRLKSSSALA
jgi:hypothetical protein